MDLGFQTMGSMCLIDEREALRVRCAGCRHHCGSALHSATYARKPRCVPEAVVSGGRSPVLRRSSCCAKCRRRTTPSSDALMKGIRKKRDPQFLLLPWTGSCVDNSPNEAFVMGFGYSLWQDSAPSADQAEGAGCGGLRLSAKAGRTESLSDLNRSQAWSARLPLPHVSCMDAWISTGSS